MLLSKKLIILSVQSVVVKDAIVNSFETIKGPTKRIKEIGIVPEIQMADDTNLEKSKRSCPSPLIHEIVSK